MGEPGKLCILCCHRFQPEVAAAVNAEGWDDVVVSAFPVRCGHPPETWDSLRPFLDTDCTAVVILGVACLAKLGEPPADLPPIRIFRYEQCFHLVAAPALVNEAIERGSYLMTPCWLADWRAKLHELGFDENNAAEFFQECSRDLVLLDTGVVDGIMDRLAELARTVGLPCSRISVGIDHTRLVLSKLVNEWRLQEERLRTKTCERNFIREHADSLATLDFLGRVAQPKDEQETIAAIEELFRTMFAPEEFHYVRFEDGIMQQDGRLPPDAMRQVQALDSDWSWTDSGEGFLLRITRSEVLLGVIVVDHFTFPEYREHYLDLALSIAGVCGLAIENVRIYRKIMATKGALRRSERSLKMAQAIAHVGHWEWNVETGEMRWSDETFRIFGFAPQQVMPSLDNFFQVIHKDDRELVASQFDKAREENSCNFEYRIVLPNGNVRTVHCGIEVTPLATYTGKPAIIEPPLDRTKGGIVILGVVQDISEHKELELQLAHEARTDALTGCANRRYFFELAKHQSAHAHRYGGEMSVLMLDLDYFKTVNDQHGHQVGDRALQLLVQICRSSLREVDVIGRIGGEEFAVLLPETGQVRALEVAERLRRDVAKAELPLDDGSPLNFTISAGVATLSPGEAFELALGRADQALYDAKNSGRNRIVSAEGDTLPQQ